MTILSCGHTVEDISEGYLIALGEEYCDWDGYKPCISYGHFCKECYDNILNDPEYIVLLSTEDEMNYLYYPEMFQRTYTKP